MRSGLCLRFHWRIESVARGEGRFELSVAIGIARNLRPGEAGNDRSLTIQWPSGRTEEYKNLSAGRMYECIEAKGITPLASF